MPEIDNLLGSTRRVVEEQEPLNNCRGVTYRVINVGGGGGGSVDYTKVVSKTDSMPVASADNADIIYLYDGETDATYTHGYIYENVPTTTSSSASAAQTVGSGLSDIAVDLETLESFTGWTTDNSLQIFYTEDGWSVDTTSLGVTYTGTPSVGDAITITYTAAVTTYAWTRVDVQPAGDSLPSQSGQSGKFLTTNGTSASWGTVGGLPDQTGQSGKFLTTDGTDASWSDKPLTNKASDQYSIAISADSTSGTEVVAIGYGAKGLKYGIAIGVDAAVQGKSTALSSIAIGSSAKAGTSSLGTSQGCIAIGYNALSNGIKGVAIGYRAEAKNNNNIQIGPGMNTAANTFCVGNANGNYTMMDANGNIPADRLGTGYDATKTQTLKNVQGVLTWVDD